MIKIRSTDTKNHPKKLFNMRGFENLIIFLKSEIETLKEIYFLKNRDNIKKDKIIETKKLAWNLPRTPNDKNFIKKIINNNSEMVNRILLTEYSMTLFKFLNNVSPRKAILTKKEYPMI